MTPTEFLKGLRAASGYRDQIELEHVIPAREARTVPLPANMHPSLAESLSGLGIRSLYTHQAEAWGATGEGRDVVVVTATASGKTLCYNLRVLDTILRERDARAMYLFPTKALAQDQLGKLGQFGLGEAVRFGTYDGDTPKGDRGPIRKTARIVLTNPDMLHVGILPNYENWLDFLRKLRYVVVDEMHVYRGVFGSHVANVLRRLFRLCEGMHIPPPRAIACSATIGNPGELAATLLGRDCQVISNDGSPAGPRRFVIWNPAAVGAAGERRSANTEATELFVSLVSEHVRTIAFVRARVTAELLLRYARQMMGEDAPGLKDRIEAYRAGYTPNERREIERRLFGGELLGVTATNALELGIDVGGLDASIINGYPGSVSSLWQQAGRAGRGEAESATFFVAHNDPLEQHLVRHPELVLDARHEHVRVNPDNPYVLAQQLRCAVFERPMSEDEAEQFGPKAREVLDGLIESGHLEARFGRYFCPAIQSPAAEVDIRSASGTQFDILRAETHERLGTVEEDRVYAVAHPGATYLHRGEQYVVESLNIGSRTAMARKTPVDYYTVAGGDTSIDVRVTIEERKAGIGKLGFGSVCVTEQVVGFDRRALLTDQFLSYEELQLPARSFDTLAVWLMLPAPTSDLEAIEYEFGSGLHAVEHAFAASLPVLAGCDRQDIGSAWYVAHHQTMGPAIFLFDDVPGGVGICETAYRLAPEWLRMAQALLKDCPCEEGCPACLLSPSCGTRNQHLSKAEGLGLLAGVQL